MSQLSARPGPTNDEPAGYTGDSATAHARRSWYLDLALIADYWNDQSRAYHHTAPISMLYGLRGLAPAAQ